MDFFGIIYSKNKENFNFTLGERKLIIELSTHVKSIFQNNDSTSNSAKYFSQTGNKELCSALNQSDNSMVHGDKSNEFKETKTQYFLSLLMSAAEKNASRHKNGFRFDRDIRLFATYVRMFAGPKLYNFLQKNLEHALPSLPTTNRYVQESNCRVIEGVLRCEELVLYLKERNIKPLVALSEDATRIVGRIQYDIRTNQIIGFVSPLHESEGMPIPFSFPARSAQEIMDHFSGENAISSFINVIVAKPITIQRVPSFCLLLFGSNNDYTSFDVCNRWKYIVSELKKLGITAVTFSSDSDPRYNSAMRKLSFLGNSSNLFLQKSWFSCGKYENSTESFPVCIQDPTHIGTKMRNFFLKTIRNPSKLPFGKYFIQQSHLEFLIDNFTKDKHSLTPTILNPKDKQNFDSVLRMTDKSVIELLLQNVVGGCGTAKYLEIIRKIIDSFMDLTLKPLDRIYKIWYSVFMLRLWRCYVVNDKSLTLKENFMTTNCYSCVELNAHSLVFCLLRLKENNQSHHFIPSLFDSQPCEQMFRQVRSFTTTYSTVANCSVKEILCRISKIQLQNDIEVMESNLHFPYHRSHKTRSIEIFDLPRKNQIEERIECAKKDALMDGVRFGLVAKQIAYKLDISCKIKPIDYNENVKMKRKITKNVKKSFNGKSEKAVILKTVLKTSLLKNFSEKVEGQKLSETSQYVEIQISSGKRIILKKTSLCWMLRQDYQKLSSDRLQRVQSEKKKLHGKFSKSKNVRIRKRYPEIINVQKHITRKNK